MSRRPVKGDYIETDTGNKVARKAILVGTQNIMLGGKTVIQPEVMIRGDLIRTAPSSSSTSGDKPTSSDQQQQQQQQQSQKSTSSSSSTTAVAIGRYCFLSRAVHLRPPSRIYRSHFTHFPLRLGDHVFVGVNSIVSAGSIGSHVWIGADVVVGDFAIIKDYVKVLDGTVIAPHTVVPSFSVVAGNPGRVVGEVPEGMVGEFELKDLYKTVGNNPVLPVAG